MRDNMDSCVAFQSKLTSIMEMLAKAAVVEISKLWEDGFTLVQVELRRRDNEIEALNKKLMLLENERFTVSSQAQTGNLSATSSSKREQQNRLLPPNGDGKNNHYIPTPFYNGFSIFLTGFFNLNKNVYIFKE